MYALFTFSLNPTNKFSHFLVLVWNIFIGQFSLSTCHVVHMRQLMTRVITTQGTDNKQNHKTKIKQKVIYRITR